MVHNVLLGCSASNLPQQGAAGVALSFTPSVFSLPWLPCLLPCQPAPCRSLFLAWQLKSQLQASAPALHFGMLHNTEPESMLPTTCVIKLGSHYFDSVPFYTA